MLVSGRMSSKLASISLTSKGAFPAKYRLSNEKIPGCSNKLYMDTVTMVFSGQSRRLHIVAGIFSMDNLYLAGKTPLLAVDTLVSFGDILPKTSKISTCWDMGGNSHLTWLSIDRLYIPACIELELELR